jgi:hypothetical protein
VALAKEASGAEGADAADALEKEAAAGGEGGCTTTGVCLWNGPTRLCRPTSGTYVQPPNVCRQNWTCCAVSIESSVAATLNGVSTTAGPYLVGVWIGCAWWAGVLVCPVV